MNKSILWKDYWKDRTEGGHRDNNEPFLYAEYKEKSRILGADLAQLLDFGCGSAQLLSYYSYLDKNKIAAEYRQLKKVCDELDIEQESWGSRQHCLRFSVPHTFRNLEHSNINYDATLCHAEKPGFRCGICYEYPVYDIYERRQLNIIEKPLIAMEHSLLMPKYGGKGPGPEVLEHLRRLKNICRKYNSQFSLLWHNSQLAYPKERALCQALLDA